MTDVELDIDPETYQLIVTACRVTGETPSEFVRQALINFINEHDPEMEHLEIRNAAGNVVVNEYVPRASPQLAWASAISVVDDPFDLADDYSQPS